MAFIFVESFHYYSAIADLARRWDTFTNSVWALSDTLGRFGGRCVTAGQSGGGVLVKTFPLCGETAGNEFFFSAALLNVSAIAATGTSRFLRVGADGTISSVDTGANSHVSFRVLTDGTVECYRDTTLVASSSAGVIVAGSWHRWEGKILIHASTGTVLLKIDGVTVINFTGNTKNSALAANVQTFSLLASCNMGGSPFGGVWRIQDLMLWRAGGASPTGSLGDFVIDTVYPNANGATINGTVFPSGSAFAAVDDVGFPASPDADYEKLSVNGDLDVFAKAAITVSGILGVHVHSYVRGDSTGTRQMQPLIRSGGTNYPSGVDQPVPGQATYVSRDFFWGTDPDTGVAWTTSGFDNAQIGYKLTG